MATDLPETPYFARAPGGQNYHAFDSQVVGLPICGYKLTGTDRRRAWPQPQPAGRLTAFTMSDTYQQAVDKYVCPRCRRILELRRRAKERTA